MRNWLAGIEAQARASGFELSVPLTPRTLRHSCAIHLLLNGLTQKQIQLHLGHKSDKNTRIYTDLLALDATAFKSFTF